MRQMFSGLSVIFIFAMTTGVCGDEIRERLDEMKGKYREAMARASKQLEESIGQTIKSLAAEGKLDELASLSREREAFLKTGALPTSSLLAADVSAYRESTERFRKVMVDLYGQAIRQYTKQLKIDEATRLEKELKEFQASRTLATSTPSERNPASNSDDPIAAALSKALQTHAREFAVAKREMLDAIDEKVKRVASTGDLQAVKVMQEVQKEFDNRGTLESVDDPSLRRALTRYQANTNSSVSKLEAAYKKAIQDYLRKSQAKQAEELQADLWRGVGLAPRKWMTIYASADPSHWGKTYRDADSYSVDLEEVPADMQSLRFRRMETGEFVIIPLARDQLNENVVQGAIGWSGDNLKHESARRFGIYRTDVRSEVRGMVVVGRRGFTPFTGWGFGSRHNIDDRQAYVWAGREIGQTPFEIAVTAEPLDEREARFLLVHPDQTTDR